MKFACVLTSAAVVSSATAAGYIHYDIEKRIGGATGAITRRQLDVNAPLTQSAEKVEYLINITVGTPPQRLGVTLDTGSSDLWIPAVSSRPCRQGHCDAGSFDPSKSSTYDVLIPGGFNITYAAPGDSDAGDWVAESVTVGGSRTINGTILGVALDGADNHGVMGIGSQFNVVTPNPSPNGTYPTVIDHMLAQGLINREAYSLYLNDLNQTMGSICFGCVDSAKYTGNLVALPMQLSSPDARRPTEFYVTLTSVVFTDAAGAVTQLSPPGYRQSALLDSGTSDTLLTNDILNAIGAGLGAVNYQGNNIVPCSYANSNATLTYTFGGQGGPSITVPLSELIGGVAAQGSQFNRPSGGCVLGMDGPIQDTVILGDTFLRNAYAVFDLSNNQVAIAQAAGNKAGTSSLQVIPTGSSIPGVSSTATASGTQLVQATSTVNANIPSVSGQTIIAGTPTFNLGASATASNASGAGSANTSSGRASVMTAAPKAALLGVGLVAGAFIM